MHNGKFTIPYEDNNVIEIELKGDALYERKENESDA